MQKWLKGLVAVAALVGAERVEAQPAGATIRGVLLSTAGRTPIEGARITLVGTPFTTLTNARGEFELVELEAGRYMIRVAAIGYATISSPIDLRERQTLDIEFSTEAEAARLPEITVEERSTHGPMDWLRRKSEGRGRYITRTEIERRNVATLPEVMRMVPGVRVECRSNLVCAVRMMRAPRGCNPAFFMDGIPADPAIAYLTPLQEVEGVEVYTGPAETPPELESGQARCGVVVIWTRTPPPRRPKEKKGQPADTVARPVPAPADTVEAAPSR